MTELLLHAAAVGLEQIRRIFLSVDHLHLELSAAFAADDRRIGGAESVDLAEIDLVIGGVLAQVVGIGAQETVREPLREESEQGGALRAGRHPLASEQLVEARRGRQGGNVVTGSRRQMPA